MIKFNEDTFLSYTNYDQLVGLKKLKFILSTIQKYFQEVNKNSNMISILEIGCGEGNITVPLGSLGYQIRAIDVNQKAVIQLKIKIKENDFQNIMTSVSDGYTFDDGKKYDIVIASEVLEHLEDPFRFLTNISKRMRKGSYFIVTVPNGFGPWELRNRLFVRSLYYSNSIRKVMGFPSFRKILGKKHLQFFRKSELLHLISGFSFDLIGSSNSDAFFSVLWTPLSKPIQLLEKIDIRLADSLPSWCASGWFLLFRKKLD